RCSSCRRPKSNSSNCSSNRQPDNCEAALDQELKRPTVVDRALNAIEKAGNKLPDPAALFLLLLFAVWVLSALLAPVQFTEIDPRSGEPLRVINLLRPAAIANFLATMV